MTRNMILSVLIASVLGCSPRPPGYLEALEPISHPSYSAMEEITRQQILTLRRALDEELVSPDSARQLGTAFGAIGEVYQAYGLTEAAAACYRNAQTLDPESFAWAYLLGITSRDSGRPLQAREALRRALAIKPDSPQARFRLGVLELELDDSVSARSLLNGLVQTEGFTAAAALALARVELAENNPQEAIVLLDRALELQPQLGEAHHLLSRAYRILGDDVRSDYHLSSPVSESLEVPDRLLSRIEKLAVGSGSYLRRGNQALVRGDFDAAVQLFQSAVEIAPENTELRRSLAHAHLQKGEFRAAIAELETAVETDPDNAWLQLDLGNAAAAAGLADRAMASFRRAVAASPELIKARFNLANALMAAEQWPEALVNLEAIAEFGADDHRSRYLTAMARHHMGQSAKALEALRRELADDPTNTVAVEGIGTILVETGREDEALAFYRTSALAEAPAEQRARWCSLWANLEWRKRRTDNALEAWKLAVELTPESASARIELANGLQLVGRREGSNDRIRNRQRRSSPPIPFLGYQKVACEFCRETSEKRRSDCGWESRSTQITPRSTPHSLASSQPVRLPKSVMGNWPWRWLEEPTL